MKKQNRETQDVSDQTVSIEITGPVFVDIEGSVADNEEKERHVQDEPERNTQGGQIHQQRRTAPNSILLPFQRRLKTKGTLRERGSRN